MKSSKRILAAAVLLIAACAALWAMQVTTPNYTQLTGPIETKGDRGNYVRGRSLAVRVDNVELAQRLQGRCIGGTQIFETSGVWVIVHASASSMQKPEMLAATAIQTPDGVTYARSERPAMCGDLLYEEMLQPDVPTSGDIVFELPAEALVDADLVASSFPIGLAPLDSQLRIHLGVDAQSLSRRLATVRNVYELKK